MVVSVEGGPKVHVDEGVLEQGLKCLLGHKELRDPKDAGLGARRSSRLKGIGGLHGRGAQRMPVWENVEAADSKESVVLSDVAIMPAPPLAAKGGSKSNLNTRQKAKSRVLEVVCSQCSRPVGPESGPPSNVAG